MKSYLRAWIIPAFAGASLLAASAALAVAPQKGATYKGKSTDQYPKGKSETTTLKVSKDGKTVTFSSSISDSCAKKSFQGPLPISNGKFSGTIAFPTSTTALQTTGSAHVTGHFTDGGKSVVGGFQYTVMTNLILFTSSCGTAAAHPITYSAKR